MALGSLASKPAFLARLRPVLAARRLCAVPPPVSPQRADEPSPYMQLLPACLSGVAIGTYASVPGVLGPHIARTQGVLAQVASDFSMSAIPPTVVSAGLVSGVLSIALAPHVKTLGARRIALAGSVLFPLGFFALPACAATVGHWPSFVASTSVLGGVGFWCVYPQLPPLLTRWFRERQGLAVSIYFASFGSGLVVATSAIERLLSAFRRAPTRLGGIDWLESGAVRTGAGGERLADVDGAVREVVVATQRDLSVSGFPNLEEGCFLLDGDNGVVQAMLAMAALNFAALHSAAWLLREPPDAPAAADGGVAPAGDGLTLAEAQRQPHMALLAAGTFGICVSGIPFLTTGKLVCADLFSAAALPPETVAAAVATYPSIIGMANLVGRAAWGPVSDRLGCGTALAMMGIQFPALLAMPAATSLLAADPATSLGLFRAAACVNVVVFAGTPVVLAPAVRALFGARDTTAIYQRLQALIVFASPAGAALLSAARDHSYLKHATALAEACDEAAFAAAFGGGRDDLAALVKTNACTLPLLLRISPEGTPDPTPLLYNEAFTVLGATSAIGASCFVAAFRIAPPR